MFSIKKCKGPNARRQTTCRDILKTNFYYVTDMELTSQCMKKQKRRSQSQNCQCYRLIPTQNNQIKASEVNVGPLRQYKP